MSSKTPSILHDPIYGAITIDPEFQQLIMTPEFQRLNYLKQMGLCFLAYPGAQHTRFAHSLGVLHLVTRFLEKSKITGKQVAVAKAAALLHDIGRAPFSHTTDFVLKDHPECNVRRRTEDLIRGKFRGLLFEEDLGIFSGMVPHALERVGIDPDDVCNLLFGRESWLSSLLRGWIDFDRLDYIVRDSFYTNISYGAIDLARILDSIRISEDRVVIEKNGIKALESLIIARELLSSNVYYNEKVRSASSMLLKMLALSIEKERIDPLKFAFLDDERFLSFFRRIGEHQRNIVASIMIGDLLDATWSVHMKHLDPDQQQFFSKLAIDVQGKLRFEYEIASEAHIPHEYLAIDIPFISPFEEFDAGVMIQDTVVPLKELSPIGRWIFEEYEKRQKIIAFTRTKYRNKLRRVLKRLIQAGR